MPNLRVYIPVQPGQLFPQGGEWDQRAFGRATLYNAVLAQLFYVGNNGKVEGGLIETIHSDPSHKIWTLQLRKGLKFHNGRDVSAQDVEFSLIRHLLCPYETPEKTFLFQTMEGSEKLKAGQKFQPGMLGSLLVKDRHHIEIRLKKADPFFPNTLAVSEFSIVPQEELQTDFLSWKKWPIGAGPYRIISVEQNQESIRLQKVEGFFDLAPNVADSINLETDPAKEVDLSLSDSTHRNRSEMKEIVLNIPASILSAFFNYQSFLGQNRHFRRAVFLAIDRKKLSELIPHSIAKDDLISSDFAQSKSPVTTQNLEEARKIFSELEIKQKFIIPLSQKAELWHRELQHQLSEAGLLIEYAENTTAFLSSDDKTTPFDLGGLIPDAGHPVTLYSMFCPGGPYGPQSQGSNLGCAQLINAIANSRDCQETEQYTFILADYFKDEALTVPFVEKKLVYLAGSRVLDIGSSSQRQTLVFHKISVK